MSYLIFCVSNVVTGMALACRSRTFVGPNEEEYVWRSKNDQLEVRVCSGSPHPV